MAALKPWRQGLWPLLVAVALLGAGATGWWLGSRQRPAGEATGAHSARVRALEGEIQSLRRRVARQQATPADQQRLLELLVVLGRRQEAIGLLEPLADREPDRWSLRLMLAELRRDRGDRAGAERELRMILNRRSDQMEALQLMTLLQLEQGRGAAAEARVRSAYQKAVRPPVQPQALGLGLLLAELQQKRGQGGAAAATYRQLATDFPEDQRPLLGLALLRHEQGDRNGALAALQQARQRLSDPGKGDPRLDRLATSWGLEPLRGSGASAKPASAEPGTASPARSIPETVP